MREFRSTLVVAAAVVWTGSANAQQHEVAKLLPADGDELALFGWSVALSDETALCGARGDNDNGAVSGSAYIFTNIGGVWTEQAKLLASDGTEGDNFGWSVAIDGDTAVIGAFLNQDNGISSGSAYVFVRSGNEWNQQSKLVPSDGTGGDYFGRSVSVNGDTIVIGAERDDDNGSDSGSAYVFTWNGNMWVEQAKLLPSNGAAGHNFGASVCIHGDTALIGTPQGGSGSTYVFIRSGDVWAEQGELLASDGTPGDLFGYSVSLSNNRAVIGAIGDDENGDVSGSAYVYVRSGDVWSEETKLQPSDGTAGDRFGQSVSIERDTMVIGANLDDDSGSNSGSAYVFALIDGSWVEHAKLLASDGAEGAGFGYSASLSGNAVLVGAPGDREDGGRSGSAYVFEIVCAVDLNGDDVADTRDFVAFLNAWSAGEMLADWDNNNIIDTRDFVAFLNDWVSGCP